MRKGFCLVLAASVMISIAGCTSNTTPLSTNSSPNTPPESVLSTVSPSPELEVIPSSDPVDVTTDTVSLGEKNALGSADSYLSFTAFSYDGLIRQLEYEGYTTEEATYAADHCGADWNEQALLSAKNYLDYTAFSYSGLIKQLEFEKFSTEQATYAADHCGADWNEQAAKSAKNYLSFSSFSRQGLIDQLEFEGFTNEQAVYGVTANGY